MFEELKRTVKKNPPMPSQVRRKKCSFHYFNVSTIFITYIRILFYDINMNNNMFFLKPSEQKEFLRWINSLLLTGDYNMFLTFKIWFYCNRRRIFKS